MTTSAAASPKAPKPWKIGVVGCGAVGGFYGARLARAGHETHFLLRGDYDAVRREGVRIHSVDGDFAVRPHAANRPEQIGPCDLVVIALKTTANHVFPALLPPLVGPRTRVLTLQNGLGNEAALAAVFGPERIFGGLCFVCLNRVAPGVIRHLAHGRIVLGEYQRPAGAAAREIAAVFADAGVPCRVAPDLERAHWEKLIWNIPFNGVGVAGRVGRENLLAGRVPEVLPHARCLPTDVLLADPGWERLLRALMAEVIRAANALGHALPAGLAEENLERTRCMGDYRASTLLDFEAGRPLELDSLFLEPQRLAHQAGVATPVLDALCAVLRELDARQRRAGAH
jgi:2-dehydropantoate 2-reductase